MSQNQLYTKNIEIYKGQAQGLAAKLKLVAIIRVIWFISFLITFVYLINLRLLLAAILSFIVFVIGFIVLVILYNKTDFKLRQCRYLGQINSQELNRLTNNYEGLDTGQEYLNNTHSYANDLDIFGEQSIFQLLNRTSTVPGRALLANRLLGFELPENLMAYQKSVKELSENVQFRQKYQAFGMHLEFKKEDYDSFIDWLKKPIVVSPGISKTYLILLPALFVVSFLLATLFSVTYYILLPQLILHAVFLASNHKKTTQVVEKTASVVKLLRTYRNHIQLLKSTDFRTDFISNLQAEFLDTEVNAEKEISNLSAYLDQLQSRNNILHIFINLPFLLDLQWLTRLEDWKNKNAEPLEGWLRGFAEIEVLNSLGGVSHLFPKWDYPQFTEEPYVLEAENIGHPLILEKVRATNSFYTSGKGKAIIVTGPNMAGKSTFLRTMALNSVLARMGSPVCASKLLISKHMSVYTVMRTQDNLAENISSFYAELDRIKQLLQEISSGKQILYFLDELLKGTNSADRHKGAEALVRQLIKSGVTGFISTHDIELGKLTRQLPEVSNYSFESDVKDGAINFDYKIREGICSSFNASELMRRMGIEID